MKRLSLLVLLLALSIPVWSAPHSPTHEVKGPTQRFDFFDVTTTESRHAVAAIDGGIRMPYAVGVVCDNPVRVELVVPHRSTENKYPDVWLAAYFESFIEDDEGFYTAYFEAEQSFGAFDYSEMYVRLQDLYDGDLPYIRELCTVAWFYDIPVQETIETYPPGCTSAWSDYCS